MDGLREAIDGEAERTAFAGVVRVDRGGTTELEAAYGLADRAHGIAMTPAHQLGTASVTKGFTALTVPAWSPTARCRCRPRRVPCSAAICP